jgi:hypothetical protein
MMKRREKGDEEIWSEKREKKKENKRKKRKESVLNSVTR